MKRKQHWETVYQTKGPKDLSWFQNQPTASLKLIPASGVRRHQAIIDLSGGSSALVNGLLDADFQKGAVLDISATALDQAQKRLGTRAQKAP